MGTAIVNDYTISTSADPDTAAALLGKAWTANGLRARSKIEDLGNRTYRMGTPLNGVFDVNISANGSGTVITSAVRRTRTSQTKLLLLIPMSPKKVHINGIIRNVMEKLLPQYLAEEGYSADVQLRRHPLNG